MSIPELEEMIANLAAVRDAKRAVLARKRKARAYNGGR